MDWQQLVLVLIPVVTPMITAAMKKIAPKIPKLAMVILQPVLGAVIGGLGLGDPTMGAAFGAGGSFVYEATDQAKKALTSKPEAASP